MNGEDIYGEYGLFCMTLETCKTIMCVSNTSVEKIRVKNKQDKIYKTVSRLISCYNCHLELKHT